MKKWLISRTKSIVPHGVMMARQERAQTRLQQMLYRHFIREGNLVFDIGANIGNRIDAFLSCGAKVVAVEPQPKCVERLTKKYKPVADVTVVQAAVGKTAGTMPLYRGDDFDTVATLSDNYRDRMGESGRFENHNWGETIHVEVTTLATLVDQFGIPAFIKIDVEGFEEQVLAGLSVPVGALSFEWTPDLPEAAFNCIERCVSLGMIWFHFSLGESMRFSHRQSISAEKAKDVVRCFAEDDRLFGDIYASREVIVR